MGAQVDARLRRELRDIVELERQAEGLCVERRYVRAAKRFAAAVERLRALDALGENSVVIARLQAQHARTLFYFVEERDSPTEPLPATGNDMDTGAAAAQAFELLLAAVSTMRHRRAEGTLLRGTCRATEVAHALAEMNLMPAVSHKERLADAVGESVALFIGNAALVVLVSCLQVPGQMLLSRAHTDISALGILAAYVRETLDLVATLPSDGTIAGIIGPFAQSCEAIIGPVLERECAHSRRGELAGGARAASEVMQQVKRLCDAWAAQRRTPALQRMLAPDARVLLAQSVSVGQSYCRTNLMEGQRKRSCAHCGATEPVRGDFQACGNCRRAFYCSREHQRAHWRAGHKAACSDVAASSQVAD